MNHEMYKDFMKQLFEDVENGNVGVTSINQSCTVNELDEIVITFKRIRPTHIPWWQLKKFGGWKNG